MLRLATDEFKYCEYYEIIYLFISRILIEEEITSVVQETLLVEHWHITPGFDSWPRHLFTQLEISNSNCEYYSRNDLKG